jgi:hypothetical protein
MVSRSLLDACVQDDQIRSRIISLWKISFTLKRLRGDEERSGREIKHRYLPSMYRTQDQRAKLYSASSLSQTRCLDGVLMHAKHTNFSKAILTAKSTLLESLPKGVDHSSTDAGLQMPDP